MENHDRRSQFYKEQKQQIDKSQPVKRFNEALANEVAGDARKLIVGELSETEFHGKHHEAYLNEFGIDERPISNCIEDDVSSASFLSRQISRRTFFKLGGLAVVSLVGARLLGSKIISAESLTGDKDGLLLNSGGNDFQEAGTVQKGLVIDLENCDGCLECVYACSHHNSLAIGVLWIYVFAYNDQNRDTPNFLVRLCQNCSNPPCVKVCPVRARHKRKNDGLVLTDFNLCIGCRYCMVTCPYGVNYFQWDDPPAKNPGTMEKFTDYRGRWVIGNPPKGVMGKCDFCPERQDAGLNSLVCELACPHDVLHWGDMNDPNSKPNTYLERKKNERGGQFSTFRLLESHGTKPNIIYIGQQPSEKAQPVDGPVSYTDWGLVEKRLPYLGSYEPWFLKSFKINQ